MAYPTDQDIEVTARAAFGADLTASPNSWSFTDLSDRLVQSPITISRGVVVGNGTTKSASATGITLLNDDGALTPFHPASQWYPFVDVGTPFDVSVRTNTTPYLTDDFGRTVASGWGTTTDGHTWLNTTGLSVSSGTGLLSMAATNSVRSSRTYLPHRDIDVTFDASIPAVSTGAPNICGPKIRNNAANTDFLFPLLEFDTAGVIGLSVWSVVASGFTQHAFTSTSLTYSAGTVYRCRVEAIGDRIRLKAWLPANPQPDGWMLDVRPGVLTEADDYFGMGAWVLAGNTNTLPMVFSFDNLTVQQPKYARIEGFVTDVKPSFRQLPDGSTHSVVQVSVGGIGSRLERRQADELSPLRRSIEKDSPVPLAYWPLEDKSGATSAASAFPDQPPMVVTGPAVFSFDLGDTEDNLISQYGSANLVSVAAGAKLTAAVPASTSTSWTVALMQESHATTAIIGGGSADMRILEWSTPSGTFQRWALIGLASGGYVVRCYDLAALSYADVATYSTATFTGLGHYAAKITQAGGFITVDFLVNNNVLASGAVAGTMAPITNVTVNPDQTNVTASTDARGIRFVVGHVAVYDSIVSALPTYTDPTLNLVLRADNGWAKEAAHRRADRLADEELVPLTVLGAPYETGVTQLNAQQPGSFTSLLKQAVDSESGSLLLEEEFGYYLVPRTSRYNQPVDLTIDLATFCRSGNIDPEEILQPKLDARGANIWTVERFNGSGATYSAPAEFLARRGEVRDKAVLDVLRDEDTAQHAAWRTHLSVDGQGANYPQTILDLAANPDLIDDWLICRVGSRMQRLGQPTIAGVGSIDQIIDGITETITPRMAGGPAWTATLDASPAAVWQTGTYDSGLRYDSRSSSLTEAEPAADTHLRITHTVKGDAWSQTSVPYDILALGQTNTVLWMSQVGSLCFLDGGFETGITGWTSFGSTIAASTAFARTGTGSCQLTVVGTPTSPSVFNNAVWGTVTVGASYTASAWIYSVAGVSNARINITWYTSGAAFISSPGSTPISIPAGVWTQVTLTATAPATAVWARAIPGLTSSPATGTVIYVDDVDLVADAQALGAGPYEQHCTVVRDPAISRDLPAGTAVRIANPAYWAL